MNKGIDVMTCKKTCWLHKLQPGEHKFIGLPLLIQRKLCKRYCCCYEGACSVLIKIIDKAGIELFDTISSFADTSV